MSEARGLDALLNGANTHTRSLLSGAADGGSGHGGGSFVLVEFVETEDGDFEAKTDDQEPKRGKVLLDAADGGDAKQTPGARFAQEGQRANSSAGKRTGGLMTYVRDMWTRAPAAATQNQKSKLDPLPDNRHQRAQQEDKEQDEDDVTDYDELTSVEDTLLGADDDDDMDDEENDDGEEEENLSYSDGRQDEDGGLGAAGGAAQKSRFASARTPSSSSSTFLRGFGSSLRRPAAGSSTSVSGASRRSAPGGRIFSGFGSSASISSNSSASGARSRVKNVAAMAVAAAASTSSSASSSSSSAPMIHQRRVPKSRSECNRIALDWFDHMEPRGPRWAKLIKRKCNETVASCATLAPEPASEPDVEREWSSWAIGHDAIDGDEDDEEQRDFGDGEQDHDSCGIASTAPAAIDTSISAENEVEEGTFLGETGSLSPRSASETSAKSTAYSVASVMVEQKEAASVDGWSSALPSIHSSVSCAASSSFDDNVSADSPRSTCPHDVELPLQEGEIERDVPRTYPTLGHFQNPSVQRKLVRSLTNVALGNPDIGYVQGMNYVMAQLMLHFPRPQYAAEYTFKVLLEAPAYNLRGLYAPGLRMLRSMVDQLRIYVKRLRPGLYDRLRALDLDSLHFTFNWFITLFSYTMPFEVLADVWELFFEQGWVAIFRISLVLLASVELDLLRADFETATLILRAAPTFPRKDIIRQARRIPLTAQDERAIQDIVFMDCV